MLATVAAVFGRESLSDVVGLVRVPVHLLRREVKRVSHQRYNRAVRTHAKGLEKLISEVGLNDALSLVLFVERALHGARPVLIRGIELSLHVLRCNEALLDVLHLLLKLLVLLLFFVRDSPRELVVELAHFHFSLIFLHSHELQLSRFRVGNCSQNSHVAKVRSFHSHVPLFLICLFFSQSLVGLFILHVVGRKIFVFLYSRLVRVE